MMASSSWILSSMYRLYRPRIQRRPWASRMDSVVAGPHQWLSLAPGPVPQVLKLLRRREKWLLIVALRFLRTCIGLKVRTRLPAPPRRESDLTSPICCKGMQ